MRKSQHLLTVVLAVVALVRPEVFIYDGDTCELQEHLVVDKVQVRPNDQTIHWVYEESGTMVSETVLIQEYQEFHIKDKKLSVVTFDGDKVVIATKGKCK